MGFLFNNITKICRSDKKITLNDDVVLFKGLFGSTCNVILKTSREGVR